jgi:hypothetical protein
MVLVHSGFLQAKELLSKLTAIWARALKNIRQRCLRLKKNLKNISLKGTKFSNCPWPLRVSGRPWLCISFNFHKSANMPLNSSNQLCEKYALNIYVLIELLPMYGTQSGTGTGF